MTQVSPENISEMPNAFLLVDKVKSDGAIESVILPKFKIPICAIFDETENLKALTELIAD